MRFSRVDNDAESPRRRRIGRFIFRHPPRMYILLLFSFRAARKTPTGDRRFPPHPSVSRDVRRGLTRRNQFCRGEGRERKSVACTCSIYAITPLTLLPFSLPPYIRIYIYMQNLFRSIAQRRDLSRPREGVAHCSIARISHTRKSHSLNSPPPSPSSSLDCRDYHLSRKRLRQKRIISRRVLRMRFHIEISHSLQRDAVASLARARVPERGKMSEDSLSLSLFLVCHAGTSLPRINARQTATQTTAVSSVRRNAKERLQKLKVLNKIQPRDIQDILQQQVRASAISAREYRLLISSRIAIRYLSDIQSLASRERNYLLQRLRRARGRL